MPLVAPIRRTTRCRLRARRPRARAGTAPGRCPRRPRSRGSPLSVRRGRWGRSARRAGPTPRARPRPPRAACRRSGKATCSGRPIMRATSPSSETDAVSNVPWPTPSRSTVTRSATASTSGSRWLTYTMPTPSRACSSTSVWRCSTASGTERGRRLVEEQHLRPRQQRLRDLEELPLGERERARGRRDGDVEPERRQRLLGPALHAPVRRPRVGRHGEIDVLGHRQVEHVRVVLIRDAEPEPPGRGGGVVREAASADLDRSLVRCEEAARDPEQMSISRTRSPRRGRGSRRRGSRR